MAERIDNLSPLRPRIYPWDKWTDGSAWRIRRGEDFEVAALSMAAMVRLRAKAEGLKATCRVVEDGEAVEFQFSEPEREAA
ncbi:MAG TPA: hypothetical protein VK631_08670 [Solirubrobacteraceae bacterium]|nr:hypothetical protein [Solirubrobacteraceae bacterium]